MCPRALVLVTLALIWTSSLSVWSATAHPLVYGTSSSSIVPRAGAPILISEVYQSSINTRRLEYFHNPRKVNQVRFDATNNREKKVSVQFWNGISGRLASGLVDSSSRNTHFPAIVVTAYVHNGIIIRDRWEDWQYSSGAELHIAPLQPPGWDPGTAVWEHILALGLAPDVIHWIARNNPALSQMLYEEIGPGLQPIGIFHLVRLGEKPTVLQHYPYRKVILLPS